MTKLGQCGIGNGEPTLAQRSKLRCANVANLCWANGTVYVGPTLGQRSCAMAASLSNHQMAVRQQVSGHSLIHWSNIYGWTGNVLFANRYRFWIKIDLDFICILVRPTSEIIKNLYQNNICIQVLSEVVAGNPKKNIIILFFRKCKFHGRK